MTPNGVQDANANSVELKASGCGLHERLLHDYRKRARRCMIV
jgi:hypothetical protein